MAKSKRDPNIERKIGRGSNKVVSWSWIVIQPQKLYQYCTEGSLQQASKIKRLVSYQSLTQLSAFYYFLPTPFPTLSDMSHLSSFQLFQMMNSCLSTLGSDLLHDSSLLKWSLLLVTDPMVSSVFAFYILS